MLRRLMVVFSCLTVSVVFCMENLHKSNYINKQIAFFQGEKEDLACMYFNLASAFLNEFEIIEAINTIKTAKRVCGKSCLLYDFDSLQLSASRKIAEGESCRLFGLAFLPKWSNPFKIAVEICDKLIESSRNYHIVAQAMLIKAKALVSQKEWYCAVSALQDIVDEFGGTEEAIEAKIELIDVCTKVLTKSSLDYSFYDIGCKSFEDVVSLEGVPPSLILKAQESYARLKSQFSNNLKEVCCFYNASGESKAAEIILS